MAGFPSFLWLNNIPLWVYVCVFHGFFIHSSVGGYLGNFCILAIVNNAVINLVVHIYFEVIFSFPLARCAEVGHMFYF